MGRFIAGVASAVLLMTAGFFIWRAQADRGPVLPPAPEATISPPMSLADLAGPPEASERTREEKRFARYDKDRNGMVGREEYFVSRQKAFAKIDLNHDGKLSFDEYAAKAAGKFLAADRDRNGQLNATEFATTRVVRKTKPRAAPCPPTPRAPLAAQPDEAEES